MTEKKDLALVGIGNAIIDALALVEPEFLRSGLPCGVEPGAMTLVNEDQSNIIFSMMKNPTIMSGGSTANTLASFAAMGGKAGYIGKVANDDLGKRFIHDLENLGIEYKTKPLLNGPSTARCMSLVTQDSQRTMCTYLGASVMFTEDDVDESLISRGEITYLEGYLYDDPNAKAAYHRAAEITHKYNGNIALSLSDPFCVARHRNDFIGLIKDHVDILFANEEEIKILAGLKDVNQAHETIAQYCDLVIVTLGAKGSQIKRQGEAFSIAATPPSQLVDTTGAGDAYAAGFLYGYTQGEDMLACGIRGSKSAANIISHMGARPITAL